VTHHVTGAVIGTHWRSHGYLVPRDRVSVLVEEQVRHLAGGRSSSCSTRLGGSGSKTTGGQPHFSNTSRLTIVIRARFLAVGSPNSAALVQTCRRRTTKPMDWAISLITFHTLPSLTVSMALTFSNHTHHGCITAARCNVRSMV
jgi:hypothetical protein